MQPSRRRLVGIHVLCCLAIAAGCASASWSALADQRPNIVLILVDDMGYSDIGCYGSEVQTPNLDRLAADGLRFTQFYNSGRCCPTRASLMTGLHPHQVGIGHMTAPPNEPLDVQGAYQGYLSDNCVTIAEVLRAAGYHTFMTGKWHLGVEDRSTWPLQRGFDRYYGGLSGAFNYFHPGGNRGLTRGNEREVPGDDFYATDAFTDEACRYVTEATEADDRPSRACCGFPARVGRGHAAPFGRRGCRCCGRTRALQGSPARRRCRR
ncbi:Arylsulfatase [Botrimarina colliarenosi]|uniref:Arylsulfatase n=1 Tax=Botrimarina colliarenosi TaxID=2528001 RepID=A0A5C6A101_9BACT|nr:sulfatase-like hydrolase/transferase [Botrimarina colliarenosi]TWT92921.1 Arylsulfatase [Botrimarina colliarenosi]